MHSNSINTNYYENNCEWKSKGYVGTFCDKNTKHNKITEIEEGDRKKIKLKRIFKPQIPHTIPHTNFKNPNKAIFGISGGRKVLTEK